MCLRRTNSEYQPGYQPHVVSAPCGISPMWYQPVPATYVLLPHCTFEGQDQPMRPGTRDRRNKGEEEQGTGGTRERRNKGEEEQGTGGTREGRNKEQEEQGTGGTRDRRNKTGGTRDRRNKGQEEQGTGGTWDTSCQTSYSIATLFDRYFFSCVDCYPGLGSM